jgi:hypothetical protein
MNLHEPVAKKDLTVLSPVELLLVAKMLQVELIAKVEALAKAENKIIAMKKGR